MSGRSIDYSIARKKTYGLYRVRCTKCNMRRTLPKLPDFYIRPPKCACGCRDWAIDWYRTTKRESRSTTCKCMGMPFPHRRGSAYPSLGAACDRCVQVEEEMTC